MIRSPLQQDERPDVGPGRGVDDVSDFASRRRSLKPQPPKTFKVERFPLGLKVTVTDHDRKFSDERLSGSTRFDVYQTRSCDVSSKEGIDAGFARADMVCTVNPPGEEDKQSIGWITDRDYFNGYFWCVGVAIDGVTKSEYVGPIQITEGGQGEAPGNVTHFVASESGEEHDGTVYSVISYSLQVPQPLKNFFGVQFAFLDYPVINEIQKNGIFHQYTGVGGGSMTGKLKLPVGRRPLTGTISISGTSITGSGTAFLSEMNAGDYIEVFGTRQEITSVTSDTAATLSATWGGTTVSGDEAAVIAKITLYAISVGRNGEQRNDFENLPQVELLLDGLLSAPVAPGSIDAQTTPEGILVEISQVDGTEIDSYLIFRSTGSTEDFSTGSFVAKVQHNPNERGGLNRNFIDNDFTISQKEEGQVFRYYVLTRNARGQLSTTYATDTASCRLSSSQDNDPTVPSRSNVFNRLWNAYLGNTGGAGTVVSGSDTGQDAFNTSNSGTDYPGNGIFAAWSRWEKVVGGSSSDPTFENETEIKFPGPGTGAPDFVQVVQRIGAWGNGTARNRKIKKGGLYCLSCYVKYVGTQPTGTFLMGVRYLDSGGTTLGFGRRRYRDPADDELKWYADSSSLYQYTINGSDLVTDWVRIFAIYWLDPPAGTVDRLEVVFTHLDSASGGTEDIYMTQPMLSEGDELAVFTAEMGDIDFYWPTPTAPPIPGDGPGTTGPHYQ